MKTISILGSTGSIGTQTLEVVRQHSDLKVAAISGNNNIKLLAQQILEFAPKLVCVYDEKNVEGLFQELKDIAPRGFDCNSVKVVSGMEGLIDVAVYEESNIVVTAIVGMVGIRPTMAAIQAGKDIALANKETLVCAGSMIMAEARKQNINIYPVDSEHSAIFQSLQGEPEKSIDKIILTASGGPFRGYTKEQLKGIRLEDALKHPNWSMGMKVTIDSSTLANKGLEVMEAKWLFDVTPEQIQVVIQPQSIVHSAVQYNDGAIIAQLGTPDMKIPIQYALLYPERRFLPGKRVDFFELGQITFEKPDTDTFKALKLAYEAITIGGSMPTVFNAANERAVKKFIAGEISYLDISDMIEKEMKEHQLIANPTLDEIISLGESIMNK
ncbi:MAG: 1-deoxy-D-xylulose-5-phosphate reductoisomerase [Lachnospiraceae bacterium]|nr:1-deoxy-D-xylulose-5-phosphate reductoisomerase [Lachnospiraceae bacterium]